MRKSHESNSLTRLLPNSRPGTYSYLRRHRRAENYEVLNQAPDSNESTNTERILTVITALITAVQPDGPRRGPR